MNHPAATPSLASFGLGQSIPLIFTNVDKDQFREVDGVNPRQFAATKAPRIPSVLLGFTGYRGAPGPPDTAQQRLAAMRNGVAA
ncbi:MAG: hypothetical protein HY855_25525 [Burkholderiales bacterium]|nr:hypothetical protein [Burkholderiales bacterium]